MAKLVLFGATGQTGTHILKMALEDGLEVRAYARSPDKIGTAHRENANLEVAQGDFGDTAAIEAAIEGADFVICVGGGPSNHKPGLMLGLTQAIVAGMRAHGVKRFVFQAGAFSPAPGTQNPFMVRVLLRPIFGTMFGISGMLAENDAVMAHVHSDAQDLDWTFTRPGQIQEKPSKGELKASDTMSGACTFVDLARLNLKLAQSDEQVRAFPYVNY